MKRDPNSPWYRKAVQHWDAQEASDNGVLGGFGHVTEVDIRDSRQILHKVPLRARSGGAAWLAARGTAACRRRRLRRAHARAPAPLPTSRRLWAAQYRRQRRAHAASWH